MAGHPSILFVSTAEALPWGGSEALWVETAQKLAAAGIPVAFSYQYWSDKPKPLQMLEQLGGRAAYRGDPALRGLVNGLQRRGRRWRQAQQYPNFRPAHWLLSLVMDITPSLVVVNLSNAYELADLYGPLRCLARQGIPYYVICQLEDESQLLFPDKRARLRELYADACGVAFGSWRGAEIVSRQCALHLRHVEVFQNPANTSLRTQPWPAGAALRMACVGRLDVGAKGQDLLMAVLSEDRWRAREWRLSLYGQGADEAYLRQLAVHYQLESKVVFAGYVPATDDIWSQEHLCLQPSPKEGTPMTVVEAMYAGRPGLVSDRARMPDLIQHGRTGWVVPRSLEALAAALEDAWLRRAELPAMGAAARAFIEHYWDPGYPAKFAQHLLGCLAAPI